MDVNLVDIIYVGCLMGVFEGIEERCVVCIYSTTNNVVRLTASINHRCSMLLILDSLTKFKNVFHLQNGKKF